MPETADKSISPFFNKFNGFCYFCLITEVFSLEPKTVALWDEACYKILDEQFDTFVCERAICRMCKSVDYHRQRVHFDI